MCAAKLKVAVFSINFKKSELPDEGEALKGREEAIEVVDAHFVLGSALQDEFAGLEFAMVGMGCFWGAERKFWQLDGVVSTAVGYSAGYTPNPTYKEVCSGKTAHNEVVRIVFDPAKISFRQVLSVFWENHNPTQGMRQGNDAGTQYRSGIYVFSDAQKASAAETLASFQAGLTQAGYGQITTEIVDAGPFYFAEDYHQQYLAKNPNGYCGLGGTGVSCPMGLASEA